MPRRRFLLLLLVLNGTSQLMSVSAQVRSTAKTYTYLIYHKLAPGMTIQYALPVERERKAINQAVDEGKLIGWHMMVKQFSPNPNVASGYFFVYQNNCVDV